MVKYYEGNLKGEGLRVGIVVSRFNGRITSRLLEGALEALEKTGVKKENIEVWKTPGSFEIPLVAKRMARRENGRPDAIICLGAIIRGETPHFDFVASEVAKGISQVSLETGVPLIFGVITADTKEQAEERAGGKMGNRGYEAALSAVEVANLLRSEANL